LKTWEITSGDLDHVEIEAESAMEAATQVVEGYSKHVDFDLGFIIECRDVEMCKTSPEDGTYFVLSSTVLANAGMHIASALYAEAEKTALEELYEEE
jgi:hypothetical protein